jgi:hypothetical protein
MSNPALPSNTPTVATNFQKPPTLLKIQTKVRRITRSPSTAQLSDADLNDYINTAVEYDLPERIRPENLLTDFSFYTNPNQDTYNTDEASFSGATNNPLYNFQNKYQTNNSPVYIAGFGSRYFNSPELFYGVYPKINSIQLIATGNGTAGAFTGFVNANQSVVSPISNQFICLLQNNVTFSAIGTPGTSEQIGMAMVDVPLVDAATGFKLNFGNLYDANGTLYNDPINGPRTIPPTVVDATNNINYITGKFTVTFPMSTIVGTPINSQTVPVNTALPQALMFYSNTFVVRPVPDQAYRVNFQVRQRPVALLATNQVPELEEWWQYIAYLAIKKIFEDRMDLDSVQMILPELKMQENLCLRRTLVQNGTQRATTIYADPNNNNGNNGSWGNGSPGSW